MKVPFFRPSISEAEITEVVACLRSGWLTTGPLARRFEEDFASQVGARHAVAVNSCTAALHLAVEALGLRAGQGVLLPTLTFAATAEVVRYQGAVPVLVDCDPITGNMDLLDAADKVAQLRAGLLPPAVPADLELVGMIPVHVGGLMLDMAAVHSFASQHGLWVIEDAAHALPAAWRPTSYHPWQRCGEGSSAVTCYSFYANKTLTTGEGGMAVTDDEGLAQHMRGMSLHGLSHDAWQRYSGGSWDYRIIAAGYKYNMTDIAAALGIHQLRRAESMRQDRVALAAGYRAALCDVAELELPPDPTDRLHAWHLYPIRLRLDRLQIGRDEFIEGLAAEGIGCSVHWRPLHLHPYYQEEFGWTPNHFPTATREWQRRLSLPLFPDMTAAEQGQVVEAVRGLCRRFSASSGPVRCRQETLAVIPR